MNKNQIISVLEDWNFWDGQRTVGIERSNGLKRMERLLATEQVLVVTGPRRSGKSTLMRQYARQLIEKAGVASANILFINFEDPRLDVTDARALEMVFQIYCEYRHPTGVPYVFLDEVQEVAGWEKWVCSMHELGKARIIVSGSNAHLLSRELGTALTGRYVPMTVFPLSFREFLKFREATPLGEFDMQARLREYFETGGFPAAVQSPQYREILLGYYDDILTHDLVRRYRIRKAPQFKQLAQFYLTQTASAVTFQSAARHMGVNTNTAIAFSEYLESAYVTFLIKRFSFKFKEQDKSPRKVYAVDQGLANTVGFRFMENMGRLAESVVFMELKRRQSENPLLELYYWKNVQHHEVDFAVKNGLQIERLIQVCWQPETARTRMREVRALRAAMDEFGLGEAWVLTRDVEVDENVSGKMIHFAPLWKWLMEV